MQPLASNSKLVEVEQNLSKNDYFSHGPLPSYADAVIFRILWENQKYPEKKTYPFFYHWFVIMKQFSTSTLNRWIQEKLYNDEHSDKMIQIMQKLFVSSPRASQRQSFHKKVTWEKGQNSPQDSLKKSRKQLQKPNQLDKRGQYLLIMKLKDIIKLQSLTLKLYSLRIKIKELKFNKKEKIVMLRAQILINQFINYRDQIMSWPEIENLTCKKVKHKTQKTPETPAKSQRNI